MTVRIKSHSIEKIKEHARKHYPKETCGLLIGKGDDIEEVFPVTNLAADERRDRYVIAPDEHLNGDELARSRGLEIIGCYHSHPDWPAKPSDTDLEESWPAYLYIIVSVTKGEPGDVRAWRLNDPEDAFDEITIQVNS